MTRREDFPHHGTPRDQWQHLLRYAVLAPSLHNVQPWAFEVKGAEVRMRVERRLSVADPQDHEALLSCGFALFCLRLACWAVGLGLAVEHEPDVVVLRRCERLTEFDWEPEFATLPYLRADHRPFKLTEPVPLREVRARLVSGFPRGFEAYTGPVGLRLVEDEGARTLLASKIEQAALKRWGDGAFRRELAGHCAGLPPGVLGYPGWLGWLAPRLLGVWSPAARVSRDEGRRAAEGPVLAVLGGSRDARADWLATGECLACLVLTARWQGLSNSVFPDVVAAGRQGLSEQSGLEFPKVVVRLGVGGPLAALPRRPLAELVRFG